MDFITHGLVGITLSNAITKTPSPTPEGLTLVISSLMPDFDYVAKSGGIANYLKYHRGLTHSVFGFPFLALVLALIVKLFSPSSNFLTLFGYAFLGNFLHIFLDLTNSYGTQIFYPFSKKRFHRDWVMIIDLFFYVTLILGIFLSLIFTIQIQIISVSVLTLLFLYIVFRAVLHKKAFSLVKNYSLKEEKIQFGAYPWVISPFPWLVVIETPSNFYLGNLSIKTGFKNPLQIKSKINSDSFSATEEVEVAKKTKTAQNFLEFAQYPYLEIEKQEDKTKISWQDLRFAYFERKAFVAEIILDKDKKVVKESFWF